MKLNILCLYYDIMNLYGETGNIKVLEYHLKEQKIKYNVTYKTIDDDLDIKKYDLIMIGQGNEKNRKLCLKHLIKYKKDIKQAINDNKFFLITGNALGMFGKKLYDEDALGIFDFIVTQSEERHSEEVIYNNSICSSIYGFINHEDDILGIKHYLFDNEGIKEKNFYGTYTLGPILSRNPEFLTYFLNELIKSKDKKHEVKDLNLKLNNEAYNEFIEFKKVKKFNSNNS